jgi:hypothetical protein
MKTSHTKEKTFLLITNVDRRYATNPGVSKPMVVDAGKVAIASRSLQNPERIA